MADSYEKLLPAPTPFELDIHTVGYEGTPSQEVLTQEIEPGRFAVRSLAKYLNPLEVAKGYGRFLKKTFKDYFVPEVLGTATALGSAYVATKLGGPFASPGAIAAAGALGENIGFYGELGREEYRDLRNKPALNLSRRQAAGQAIYSLFHKYSVSEIIDVPARPALMWAAVELNQDMPDEVSDPLVGVTAGKLAADHVYYFVALPFEKSYKRWAKKREDRKLAEIAVEIE